MVQLRQSFAASRNTSLSSTASRDTLANAGVGLPAGPLHSVLVSVCEAISCCSSAQRRHRAYLYGALLYYLQLCSDAADYDSTADSSAPSAQERAFGTWHLLLSLTLGITYVSYDLPGGRVQFCLYSVLHGVLQYACRPIGALDLFFLR